MPLFTIQQRYKYYFSCYIFLYMCVFFQVRIYHSAFFSCALFTVCASFRVRFFYALIYLCAFFRWAFFLCVFSQCAFFRSPDKTMASVWKEDSWTVLTIARYHCWDIAINIQNILKHSEQNSWKRGSENKMEDYVVLYKESIKFEMWMEHLNQS